MPDQRSNGAIAAAILFAGLLAFAGVPAIGPSGDEMVSTACESRAAGCDCAFANRDGGRSVTDRQRNQEDRFPLLRKQILGECVGETPAMVFLRTRSPLLLMASVTLPKRP